MSARQSRILTTMASVGALAVLAVGVVRVTRCILMVRAQNAERARMDRQRRTLKLVVTCPSNGCGDASARTVVSTLQPFLAELEAVAKCYIQCEVAVARGVCSGSEDAYRVVMHVNSIGDVVLCTIPVRDTRFYPTIPRQGLAALAAAGFWVADGKPVSELLTLGLSQDLLASCPSSPTSPAVADAARFNVEPLQSQQSTASLDSISAATTRRTLRSSRLTKLRQQILDDEGEDVTDVISFNALEYLLTRPDSAYRVSFFEQMRQRNERLRRVAEDRLALLELEGRVLLHHAAPTPEFVSVNNFSASFSSFSFSSAGNSFAKLGELRRGKASNLSPASARRRKIVVPPIAVDVEGDEDAFEVGVMTMTPEECTCSVEDPTSRKALLLHCFVFISCVFDARDDPFLAPQRVSDIMAIIAARSPGGVAQAFEDCRAIVNDSDGDPPSYEVTLSDLSDIFFTGFETLAGKARDSGHRLFAHLGVPLGMYGLARCSAVGYTLISLVYDEMVKKFGALTVDGWGKALGYFFSGPMQKVGQSHIARVFRSFNRSRSGEISKDEFIFFFSSRLSMPAPRAFPGPDRHLIALLVHYRFVFILFDTEHYGVWSQPGATPRLDDGMDSD